MAYPLALRPGGLTLGPQPCTSLLRWHTQCRVYVYFSSEVPAVIRFAKGYPVHKGVISENGLSRLSVPKGRQK